MVPAQCCSRERVHPLCEMAARVRGARNEEWMIIGSSNASFIIDAIALITSSWNAPCGLCVLEALSQIGSREEKRDIWLRYARVLVGAMTFQLAADSSNPLFTKWESIARASPRSR